MTTGNNSLLEIVVIGLIVLYFDTKENLSQEYKIPTL